MGRKLPEEVLRDLLVDLSNNLPYKTIAKRRYTTRMTVKRIAASHDIVQERTTREKIRNYVGEISLVPREKEPCAFHRSTV
jgi:DNA invertase Pin-like site-specific DNA recombinase